jgi:hypothetical protein
LLAGRYAGRKAVVVKANDEGVAGKKFGHAIGEFRSSYPCFFFLIISLPSFLFISCWH